VPLVSVWIPSYNYARFLPEAIDSVLGQTHRELELIVFDDGSTDGSYEIAQRYANEDARVRVLHHPGRENRGIAPTIIAALEAVRGEYTCGLGADDVLALDSLERRIDALERDPEAGLAWGVGEMLDVDGKPTGELVGTYGDRLDTTFATPDPLQALLLYDYMPGHTVLIRTDLIAKVGGWDATVLYSDWEIWVRLLAHARAAFVGPPPLAGQRSHGASMSLAAPLSAQLSRRLDVMRALDRKSDAGEDRLGEPRIRALISLERAWFEFANGNTDEAALALAKAFRVDTALSTDGDYLMWWVGPHQYAGRSEWFLSALTRGRGAPGAVVAEGLRRGQFAYWVVDAVQQLLPHDAAERLTWGVISNELEARTRRPQPLAFLACVYRGIREPRLLRERWFLKCLLASSGLWHVALRARAAGRQG
jgi:Glycosyl transferase family 2